MKFHNARKRGGVGDPVGEGSETAERVVPVEQLLARRINDLLDSGLGIAHVGQPLTAGVKDAIAGGAEGVAVAIGQALHTCRFTDGVIVTFLGGELEVAGPGRLTAGQGLCHKHSRHSRAVASMTEVDPEGIE